MDNTELFEELNASAAQQRHPVGCHHYVADEEFAEEVVDDDKSDE